MYEAYRLNLVNFVFVSHHPHPSITIVCSPPHLIPADNFL